MKIVRFQYRHIKKYGIIEKNYVRSLQNSPFYNYKGTNHQFKYDGNTYELNDVKLLAPCQPSKLVCVGLNHMSHIETATDELGRQIPGWPHIFIKPSTAVIGLNDSIAIPDPSRRVCFEGEMAVVISKKAKDVSHDDAKDYVLGYTCHNDVTDLDILQAEPGYLNRGKGFDTFAPLGPWIETEIKNPDDLQIETRVNGEVRQSDRTNGLVFNVAKLISFVSNVMTLLPGDVISTGTPAGTAPMKAGDVVEVTIEGIGTLKNNLINKT